MIEGGYYLKARCIQDSDIAHAPPHVREIWDWLLKEANHKDTKVCKRGQTLRSYDDIREGLAWYIGWRKMTYSKHDCEKAMKVLKKATMITTRKTTRGMLITIINYDKFQTPENYESHSEDHKRATREPQSSHTINKNEKNERMKENSDDEATVVARTPKAEAEEFFQKAEAQELMIQMLLQSGVKETVLREQIPRFILYWTELNATGKKQRWQMQKTFEVRRRVATWLQRVREEPTKQHGIREQKRKELTEEQQLFYEEHGFIQTN